MAALAGAGSGLWVGAARGQSTDADRFRALARPALAVRDPEKSVLLAATHAGPRIVAVGERGVIVLSDDGAKTWRQARQVPVSTSLTCVRFADAHNGMAVGHGAVILRTYDSGDTWELASDGRKLAATAQLAADARAVAGDARATQLQKEAALLVHDGPDKPLLDLHYLDGKRAVATGAYNLFFETNDGGATWQSLLERLDNPKGFHLYAIRIQGDTWFIAGEQGLILRSTDGGKTFSTLPSPYEGSWFTLEVTAGNEWVVAGLRGNAFHSTDAGGTWNKIEGLPPTSILSATQAPNDAVLLANQAGELFTTRAGVTKALSVPPLPPLSQALYLPSGEILTVGMGGAILVGPKPS
jgi:photosystem II stability/assembly factor-like uncharacterized protein